MRVEQFLEGALGIEDRLNGRFSGTLRADGSAGEWAEVARSLEGRGEMRIEDGEVESFPLLRSVATPLGRARRGRAGEDRQPAGRERDAILAFSPATSASTAATMRFDPLVLESADYTLRGDGQPSTWSSPLSTARRR